MAARGHDLVLVGRHRETLLAVKAEVEAAGQVSAAVYTADLSQAGAAAGLYDATKHEGVEILVNNAGAGLKGDFFNDDAGQTAAIAHLNMISLMELTQLFGKDFVANRRGRILNIASIAAFFPGPKQPVYYATKAFVRSLSRALAYNVRGSGVTVTVLHPGITKTNFFNVAKAASVTSGATPRSVAELGYQAMMAGKIEVTCGFWNRLLTNVFARVAPYRLQAPAIDRAADI